MKLNKIIFPAFAALMLTACNDVELPETPYSTPVSEVSYKVDGKAVTLSWDAVPGATGYQIVRNGAVLAEVEAPATSYTIKRESTGVEVTYTVKAMYADGLVSEGKTVRLTLEPVPAKMAMLLPEHSDAAPLDDDEQAAAYWFQKTYVDAGKGAFLTAADVADLDPDDYAVVWIMNDRVGQPLGWENIPSNISNAETIKSLKAYGQKGGTFLLTNMATQLTVPLGYVADNMNPTVYGNGEGGEGSDHWVLNAYLGWDFQNGSDQGFYDRTGHDVYKGLEFSDLNNYGYKNLPLIGPGQREDHNCMWDCNIYGKGNRADVIANFEATTNSLVLATWGHVRDHCVAAFVYFNKTNDRGACIANGLAAYEWNQNSGVNVHQANIEGLTKNCFDVLSK